TPRLGATVEPPRTHTWCYAERLLRHGPSGLFPRLSLYPPEGGEGEERGRDREHLPSTPGRRKPKVRSFCALLACASANAPLPAARSLFQEPRWPLLQFR